MSPVSIASTTHLHCLACSKQRTVCEASPLRARLALKVLQSGDIQLMTDGRAEFRIFGTGRTANGETDEMHEQGWCFPIDSREVEEEACP